MIRNSNLFKQDMDVLTDKPFCPFNQRDVLPCKSLGLALSLLLLLGNVLQNQSLVPPPHCPKMTSHAGFPNLTSQAGSPFVFKLPFPASLGPMQHNKLSLAHGECPLPHWMTFKHRTSTLVGLALAEDCGIYHLKVSVDSWQCRSTAYFYLHILNRSLNERNLRTSPGWSGRTTFTCSQEEMTIWANLLLQLNPNSLHANQRVRLVNTMAEYLRLPSGSVSLFSIGKSFTLHQEKLRVCRRGGLAESLTTSVVENQDVMGEAGELLWPVGCQGEEQQDNLAMILEYSTKAGGMARLLGAPVLGWRVLCAPGGVRRKVKRDLRWPRQTPTPNMIIPPPTQAQEYSRMHSLYSTKLAAHTQSLRLSTILEHVSHVGTNTHTTHTQDSTEIITEPSATHGDSLLKSFTLAPEWHTQNEKMSMYLSMYIKPEVPLILLKSSYTQKIQTLAALSSITQTTLYPYSEHTHAFLDTQTSQDKTLRTSNCFEFFCSQAIWLPPCNFEECASKIIKPIEGTSHTQEPKESTFNTLLSKAKSTEASIFESLSPSTLISPVRLEGHIGSTGLSLNNTNTEQSTQLNSKMSQIQSSPVDQLMEKATAVNSKYLKLSEKTVKLTALGVTPPVLLISKMEDLEKQFLQESISTHRNFLNIMLVEKSRGPTFLTSLRPDSIHPSLQLASGSYTVDPTMTHETKSRELVTTPVAFHPHPKENPLLTVCCRATHTDSDSRSVMLSLGHITDSQETMEDDNTAKCTHPLHNRPDSNSQTQIDNHNAALRSNYIIKYSQSSSLSTTSSTNMAFTHLFTDVSPTPYLMADQLAVTEQTETIQDLSPTPYVMNQQVMSELNGTIQDMPLTPSAGQLITSEQSELEASLSASLLSRLETPMVSFTQPLPSKLEFLSGKPERSSTATQLFSVESLKVSSSQTVLLPNIADSPLQMDLQSTDPQSDLQLESEILEGTELYFGQNRLTQTTDTSEEPLLPIYPSWTGKMGVPLTHPPQISSDPLMTFKSHPIRETVVKWTSEKPGLHSVSKEKVAQESMHFIPSADQSVLQTSSLHESQQTISHTFIPSMSKMSSFVHTAREQSSHIALVQGMTSTIYLKAACMTTIQLGLETVFVSVIQSTPLVSESLGPTAEDHVDPITLSGGQEAYTMSSIPQMQSLEPSLPLCGNSVDLSWCTPLLNSTNPKKTLEHVLGFSYSHFESHKHGQTWEEYFSMLLTTLSSRHVTEEQKESEKYVSQLVSSVTELATATAPGLSHYSIDSITPSVLVGSGFSVITRTSLPLSASALIGDGFSLEKYLSISLSSYTWKVTPFTGQGHSTPKVLSTSLNQYYGMLDTLLTSPQTSSFSSSRKQSYVQPTYSSASTSSPANLPPKVLYSIPTLMATIGFPFYYSIPSKTFLDPEDGEADRLSLEMRFIDGPPQNMGSWLALDDLELHGVPLEVDLQFAPQHLLLAARDRQGLSTWLPLTVDLQRSPVEPCHSFTLTAHRSLHSILRHRHKVELLLNKISHFFNSPVKHHLSVISIASGSTVVSWYNVSLCKQSHDGVRQCHVSQIQSMWLEMSSVDGRVNPLFSKAMLPEFPITKVGPVSYRHDCFPSTPALTPGGSSHPVYTTLKPSLNASNTPSTIIPTSNTSASASAAAATTTAAVQQVNPYQWMAGVLIALLVVCFLILMVIIIAVVLYFYKGYGRTRTVAIWPAGRIISIHNMDKTAIRPRLPPLFQQEPPPPPLRLWINFTQGNKGPLSSTHAQERQTLNKAVQLPPPGCRFPRIQNQRHEKR